MRITCRGLTKIFGTDAYALKDFNVDVKSGDFVTVMGESGCGKSTLLRVIAGLEKPTAGDVYFDGIPVNDIPAQKRDIAMVFQNYVLYPNMTVYENVSYYLRQLKLPETEVQARVNEVLSVLGLTAVKNRRPRYLSGGQQQRVALAKAMVRQPKAILFDEPLSNVDEASKDEYAGFIKELKEKLPQTTFIYVTHNKTEAFKLGHKVIMMRDGGVMAYGTPNEIILNPQTIDTAYLLDGDKVDVTYGKVEQEEFITEEGQIYPLHTIQKYTLPKEYNSQELKAIVGFMGGDGVTIFNEDDQQICGILRQVCVSATISKDKLNINGNENILDEDFKLKYFGEEGKVLFKFYSEELRFVKCYGDFSLPVEVAYKEDGIVVFKCGEECFAIYTDKTFAVGEKLEVYVPSDSVTLYDEKSNKVISRNKIYPNTVLAKNLGNGVYKIGKNKIETNLYSNSKFVKLSIPMKAFLSYGKGKVNTLQVKECLDEEFIGNFKLVFCIIDGFDNYVTMHFPQEKHLLKRKNFTVLIEPSLIKIAEEQ